MHYNKSDFFILVVDDIISNIEVIGEILTDKGYNVEFATDGKQAIEWINSKHFDLILLDIMMPEMDGFEVCRIIKSDEITKSIPIIFLTARNDTESLVKGFEIGAVDYIAKPFNSAELLSRIETHIELKVARDLINKQNTQLQEEILERIKFEEIIVEQKRNLELKNHSITSSITYAKIIQDAILPFGNYLHQFFKESFIIYIPRDIVSGDFYWFKQVNDLLIVAAADCTGHGVPGALMSMLGISLLSEITGNVNWDANSKPSAILNTLRDRIKRTLNQDSREMVIADGMDMVLCFFNLVTKEMIFSGANNQAVILRNNKFQEKETIILSGDKQPISKFINETGFTDKEIQLVSNDFVYLFSDGYYDQMGGPKGNRLLRRNFIGYLSDVSDQHAGKQKDELLEKFHTWRGNNSQVDDVMVLGIKID